MYRSFRVTLLLGVFSLLLAACGGQPAATDTLAPPVPPTATTAPPTAPPQPVVNAGAGGAEASNALLAALKQSQEAKTYQVDMVVLGKGDFAAELPGVDPNQEIQLFNVSGKFDGQNSQFALKGIVASLMGGDTENGIEFIVIDGQNYVRGPVPLLGATENKWYILDDSMGDIAQPPLQSDEMLASLSDENVDLSGLVKSGSEPVDGVQCDIYVGDKDATMQVLQGFDDDALPTDEADQAEVAESKFWVCEDGYFRQMQLTIEGADEANPDQTMTIKMFVKISDFGGNFNISAPADAAPLEAPSFEIPQQP
ncbi:MAG: hypothetical protein MI924_36075 [Chloroflexales bacterium]|nr:hypothetical protein [Chloroflexales bacterium]